LHITKTAASIQTKFCRVINTTKSLSWVVLTYASQIQDDGWPPSSKIRHISATRHTLVTSDLRPEVEIGQFHTCALKNDSVSHNAVSYGTDII